MLLPPKACWTGRITFCHVHWKPKDRKDQCFPASHCSQTANDSTENQAVIRVTWLAGWKAMETSDLRRSCSLRTGTILDPNWKVKKTFGFELLICQIMHGSHFVTTMLVSLVQDERIQGHTIRTVTEMMNGEIVRTPCSTCRILYARFSFQIPNKVVRMQCNQQAGALHVCLLKCLH